jgi:hypothetical protein
VAEPARAEDLNQALLSVSRGIAPDVERLLGRRGAHGQGFTPTLFGLFEVADCRQAVDLVSSLLNTEKYPKGMINELGAPLLARHIDTLERRYGMIDSARYVTLAYSLIHADAPKSDVLEVMDLLNDYFNFLHFLIALEIPWHELSVAFEGARTVNAALADRMFQQEGSGRPSAV